MEDDLKSFNLRKRKTIKVKPKKQQTLRSMSNYKSRQKKNKAIRNHTNSKLNNCTNNKMYDDITIANHNTKLSATWHFFNYPKIKIF